MTVKGLQSLGEQDVIYQHVTFVYFLPISSPIVVGSQKPHFRGLVLLAPFHMGGD